MPSPRWLGHMDNPLRDGSIHHARRHPPPGLYRYASLYPYNPPFLLKKKKISKSHGHFTNLGNFIRGKTETISDSASRAKQYLHVGGHILHIDKRCDLHFSTRKIIANLRTNHTAFNIQIHYSSKLCVGGKWYHIGQLQTQTDQETISK